MASRTRIAIPYADIPHWPASNVIGHAGKLVCGKVAGRQVLVLSGRVHAYEGHDMRTVTFAMRVIGRMGIKRVILTNAAGGISPNCSRGALMVIDDHINLMGQNPLVGPNDERFGLRFPDMTYVYSPALRALADETARAQGLPIQHGIYMAVLGPSYETPAEIRAFRTLGADAVGMSTAPEAIVARHMGIEVLGISCITNPAAGVFPRAAASRRGDGNGARGERRSSSRCWRASLGGSEPELVAAARAVRERAAADYSGFKVGAALETPNGDIITGCNVENATYGLSVCAERVAVFKAISEGHREFTRVVVVADTDEPTPPCGACRQILWEFGGDLEVILANLIEVKTTLRLRELLPMPFDKRLLLDPQTGDLQLICILQSEI